MYKWIQNYEMDYHTDVLHFEPDMLLYMLNHQLGLSVSTSRRYIDDLNGFFAWAMADGCISTSPMSGITYRCLDFTQPIKEKCFSDYHDIAELLRQKWTPDEGEAVYPITIFAWMTAVIICIGVIAMLFYRKPHISL